MKRIYLILLLIIPIFLFIRFLFGILFPDDNFVENGITKRTIVNKYGNPTFIIHPEELILDNGRDLLSFIEIAGGQFNNYKVTVKEIYEEVGDVRIPRSFEKQKKNIKEMYYYHKSYPWFVLCFDKNNTVVYSFTWD